MTELSRRSALKLMGLTGLAASTTGLGYAQEDMTESLPNGAGFYRFALGDYSIVVLSDGQSVGGSLFPNFAANPDRENVYRETLERYGAPIEPFINNFNPMLIDTGDKRILMDTGLGTGVGPTVGLTVQHLQNAGYSPDDIDTVFITHGHPDHIQGLLDGGEEVFPNAELKMGETDFNFWTSMSEPPAFIQNVLIPLQDRFSLINDGDEIASGVSAVATPGHTVGHMAVMVNSGSQSLMHYGDAGGHYLLSPKYPEHYLGFDADKEQVVKTRATMFEQSVIDDLLVVGYHFAWPGVGRILREGDAYAFAPTFWQW